MEFNTNQINIMLDALEHYGQRHAMAAVRELGLETGKEAVAVIKATSVMFGVE